MRQILSVLALALFFASCQKEIDWGLNSGADGDLLVKSIEITQATNDSNIITLQYDGQKRLIEYRALGKVNGTTTNITHLISRQSDGKITKIVSRIAGSLIDSTVYIPTYDGNKLSYVLGTQYTTFANIEDSVKYTYNGLGFCVEIERFSDITGTMEGISKQTFVHDASGNPITEMMYIADGFGGYDIAITTNYTYNGRKSAVTLGDESLIVFPVTTSAKNDLTEQVVNSLLGTDLTYAITGQLYNNNNRPRQLSIKITPQPPGYDLKVVNYYQ